MAVWATHWGKVPAGADRPIAQTETGRRTQ